MVPGQQGETQGLEHRTETGAPDFGSRRLIDCRLDFPGLDWIAYGNCGNGDSVHCTELSGFKYSLNDIPRAFWGHSGEKEDADCVLVFHNAVACNSTFVFT